MINTESAAIQRQILADYKDEYGSHREYLIVQGADETSFTVTILNEDEGIIRIYEITNAVWNEEGLFSHNRTVYHAGHYELAKETVAIFLRDNMEVTYKDYTFHYSGSTVFLGVGNVYLSMEFSTYTVVEEGYSHELGRLSNPKLLGVNDSNYDKTLTVLSSGDYGKNVKVTYQPDDIISLTAYGLRHVTGILLENESTGFSNFLKFEEDDLRKPLFHALALYFGVEKAVRFFYMI